MTQTNLIPFGIYIFFLLLNAILAVRAIKKLNKTNNDLNTELYIADSNLKAKTKEYENAIATLKHKTTDLENFKADYDHIKRYKDGLERENGTLQAELDKLKQFDTPFLKWLAEKVEKCGIKGKDFKIGDKVKALSDGGYDCVTKGDTGIIVKGKICANQVQFDKTGRVLSMFDNEIELVSAAPAQLAFTDLWQSYLETAGDSDTGMDKTTFGRLLTHFLGKPRKSNGKVLYQGVKWRT